MQTRFQAIVELIQRLPGIGPRHATRIVLSLLERPVEELHQLGESIAQLKDQVQLCQQCFNLTDEAPLCRICKDSRRDASTILVVEKVTDLQSIERAGIWKGLYHILGGTIAPVDGIHPEQLKIDELASRVDRFLQEAGSVELVLAMNPTAHGEMTARYLRDLFSQTPGVSTTRLARGLATGTHLEYADEITLKYALESRK